MPRGMEFKDLNGETDITVSASYQQSIWRDNNVSGLDLSILSPRSQVLLTACAAGKNAYEDHERREGRFTAALLRVLKGADRSKITYKQLMRRLEDLPGCVMLSIPPASSDLTQSQPNSSVFRSLHRPDTF